MDWLLLFALVWLPQEDSRQMLQKGRDLLDRKELTAAEQAFREASVLEPEDSRIHYYLGVTLLQLGRVGEAVTVLERARESAPRPNPAVFFELGNAYFRADRWDEAIGAYQKALEIAPDDVPSRLQLGYIYYSRVDGERAEAEFKRVVEAAPSALAFFYLGLAESALGKSESATRSFKEAVRLRPGWTEAMLALGRTLSQSRRDEEAGATFEEVLAIDSTNAEAANGLGLLALRAGRPEEAGRYFAAALESDPGQRQACYNLWQVYERLGHKEKARQMRARFEKLAEIEKRAPNK